jgi:Kef-type K+ transport system membrane component KefB
MGIAFLLFIVGLEISLNKLKEVGFMGVIGGSIQIVSIFFAGFFIALHLGFSQLQAGYIGLILTFSSTMIVIKLLSDKNELNTLHGRIILAILIMQDIAVIFALSLIETLDHLAFDFIWISLLKGFILIAITLLSGKYVLPYLFKVSARHQELLFLSSLAIVFFFAGLAYALGFSVAIGAFLAGLSLANLPYNFDIVGKVMPLRNFFATIFFVSLGMELAVESFKGLLFPLIVFLAVVIFLKPAILFILGILFGYKRRTSFLTALSLAQISEFSLILVSLGLGLGHITNNIFTITVLLAIITITLTSYFIHYDEKIYSLFAKPLAFFERLSLIRSKELEHFPHHPKREVIIFGAHRMGGIFINTFRKLKDDFVVIDFDPEIIKNLIEKKIPCIYGDLGNFEILKRLNLHSAKMVISTVPNEQDNEFLINYVKKHNPKVIVIVMSPHGSGAVKMYEHGADYVIVPHLLSGEMVARFLRELMENKKDIDDIRLRHIKHLKDRGY